MLACPQFLYNIGSSEQARAVQLAVQLARLCVQRFLKTHDLATLRIGLVWQMQ
jgi:hypothetical protein